MIEGTCYCCGNPRHDSHDFLEAESTPKYKWAFKIETQNLCAESQKAGSQPGNKKTQSTKDEEENMSTVKSWTTGTQHLILEQSLFVHVLSNIVGYLDIKPNELQNIMVE